MAASFANLGEEDRAERYRARALDLARRSGSRLLQGAVAYSRGTEAIYHGRLDDAQALLTEAIECHSAYPGHNTRLIAMGNLAMVAALKGDGRRALAWTAQARQIVKKRGGAFRPPLSFLLFPRPGGIRSRGHGRVRPIQLSRPFP